MTSGLIGCFFLLLGCGAVHGGAPPAAVQVRFEPAKPGGYFWGKKDGPAGTLVFSNHASAAINVDISVGVLNHRAEPVGEPLRMPTRLEPGKPVEQKLPLRPERFGVYFIEVQMGETRQRFSLAWLPEPAPIWPDSPFGVCTHFGQHKHKVPDTLELIARMGAAWIRDEISWGGVERKKGQYTFDKYFDQYMEAAGKLGIRPLILFDYGNDLYGKGESPRTPEAFVGFAEYCRQLMRRYGPVCRDWEVWNEPNITVFWKPKPNVEDYTSLMKAVYPAAKAANPKATIVGVCTAGTDFKFIEGVLQRDGGKFMDAISVHPYRYPRPPEASDLLGEMGRLKAMLDQYGVGHLKVWLTEYGYPTQQDPRGVAQHRSAAYLVRTSLLALSLPYIERLFIYDFQDDGPDPKYNEHNFGVIRFDGSPKPAYAAHCTMARLLYRRRFIRAIRAGEGVFAYEFAGEAGRVLAAWTSKEPATLFLPTAARRVTVTDLMGNERVVAAADSRLALPLTEEPVFIAGHD